MRPARSSRVLLMTLLISCSSCGKPDPGPNGATCTTNGECQSDLCYHEICLDPLGDDDGDGLVNKVEALVTGTRADNRDTDGDGIDDLTEVGSNPSDPLDSDDDGVHNAMESAITDSDCDGLADQYDNPNRENDPDAVGVVDPDNPEACLADSDQDGIANVADNCTNIPNPDQVDLDQDGVGEACDLCTSGPDGVDQDGDGIPDDCDLCPGTPDGIDLDGDGVPSGCDVCPLGDDNGPDGDQDGVPDDCDICPLGDDNGLDGDQDGVPIECDICPGFDDHADGDEDGIPDGCDVCPLGDDDLDTDKDGVPDDCDICPLGDDNGPDGDQDGVPDDCDICPLGDDNGLDGDQDGVPDDCDICPDFDDHADGDEDGIPDGCDVCPLGDDDLDTDEDGVPDDCDLCPQGPDSDGEGCDGQCSTLADCDDENPCSDDLCEAGTNQCTHILAAGCECLSAGDCDDGDPCTVDTCGEGSVCGHEDLIGCCQADEACSDEIPCTIDTCDAVTQQCSNVPDPGSCDDGDACTLDTCDPSVGCVDTAPSMGISGLSEDHEGNLLWSVYGEGPEPTAEGHPVCGVNALYYLASRDYDGIDEQSPGSFHLTEANEEVFGGLLGALEATGHGLEEVHWRVGLMSLGADKEGEDWWWETDQTEVRHYYPVADPPPTITITLGTVPMLSGTLQYITSRTVFPENCDGTPTDISGHTSPVELSNVASTLSDADLIANALLEDLAGEALQIRFSSFQPALGSTYNVDGRIGAFFETQEGSVARVPLSCNPE